MTTDWDEIRKNAISKDSHPDWPNGVNAISISGLALVGVDKERNLYWDGKPIEIRKSITLTKWQKFWALVPIIIGSLVGIKELAGVACIGALLGYNCPVV